MNTQSLKNKIRTSFFRATLFLLIIHLPPQVASGFDEEVSGPLSGNLLVSGLEQPLFLTAPPGDHDRLVIVEKPGRILIYDRLAEELREEPFLTLTGITSAGERGLLGLAFHPDYAENGTFFINFTDSAGDTQIRRYTVSPEDPNRADPSSATTVLTIPQDFSNHNGGWIGFSPIDGYLYIATGDGGSGNDPNRRGQDLSQLLGKILRIDVDGDDFPEVEERNYAIPSDNPFVGLEGRDEIWAYGLRNPWRPSFDRETGDLWIADVGQSAREWIHFQPADSDGGENYGWRVREGTRVTGLDPLVEGIVDPIYEFVHPEGRSITGGYVYRGEEIPALRGTYFFADYMEDWVRSFRFEGEPISNDEVVDRTAIFSATRPRLSNPASFGEDANGELYVISLNGDIFRLSQDPWHLWRNRQFSLVELEDESVSGPFATPAGDGLPNLLKYALGMEASTPAVARPLNAAIEEDEEGERYLTLTIERVPGAADITLTVEATSTPGDADSWSEDGTTVLIDEESLLKVRGNTPVAPGARDFLRLKVSHPSIQEIMSVAIPE